MIVGLQRSAGNQAVQRMLLQRKGGQHKEVNEDEPLIRRMLQRQVDPTFPVDRPAPVRSNSDASTTKVKAQSYSGAVVKDDAAGEFKYELNDFTSNGEIQIVYYTPDHYPAPVPADDSGALTNVTKGNWSDIADDLHANRTGIADDWSSYRAEPLHEDYHWDTEWVNTFTPELRKAEAKLSKLKMPVTPDATTDDAKAQLEPKADKILAEMVKTAKEKYFKLGDSPGDPPYIAQAPAIDALEDRVRKHGATL